MSEKNQYVISVKVSRDAVLERFPTKRGTMSKAFRELTGLFSEIWPLLPEEMQMNLKARFPLGYKLLEVLP